MLPEHAASTPLDLEARLLYRDALMLIIDKPAGIPVHAGPKGGDVLDRHFDQLQFGLPKPPALAHRLDKETSGCLVLGRHAKALANLGKLFASGRVEKTYLAVVRGKLPQDAGEIDIPLSKRSATRGWWMKADPAGLPSLTTYRVLAANQTLSLVELNPKTGRTHQLRVHLSELGAPILGDRIYGREPASAPPLHLHARQVVVPLYPNRDPIIARAELPPHLRATLDGLGWSLDSSRTS